ncbi:MAG TPA: hypothetical protein VEK33_15920 [Terriglobales bacterium]|nr:hypothetical protein [Terriglobales bacterium]
MRFASLCLVVLLFSGWAVGQATMMGGTASNWAPAYGVYLAPFVPLVTTPEVTLSTASPSAVGASNATFGLVAGATNATLSGEFLGEPPVGVYTPLLWYGPTAQPGVAAPAPFALERAPKERAFDFIARKRESGESVARLMAEGGAARKASRTYTNEDIDRVNQTTGTVKYDGKTEHI